MAQFIPDRLPSRASRGEERIFNILKNLPDDYIGYYEPVIGNRYPDFVLICPDLGVMLIEVKGWYPNNILKIDPNDVLINDRGNEVRNAHPVRQAREYMYRLMDECRDHSFYHQLLQKEGTYANRFVFPFGHFAVMTNITEDQLTNHPKGNLRTIFPDNRVLSRDQMVQWGEMDPGKLVQHLKKYFEPWWEFPKMADEQVKILRAIIHPEIILEGPPSAVKDDKENNNIINVLDLKQEQNARNIGSGHRVIYGVAGSGKTVLLICRAKLASQEQDKHILVLCYNVALGTYLQHALSDQGNVDVYHFDGWAKKNGITRRNKEENSGLGDRLLERLQMGSGDSHHYDTVLIDEAQDFEGSWFKCVLEAMTEPLDGDLMIVGDASQGLYPRGHISWKELGIQAVGRTIYRRFDLDKNYRNSKEIIEIASLFATKDSEDDDDIRAITLDPSLSLRKTGVNPILLKCYDRQGEVDRVVEIVEGLLNGKWCGNTIPALSPKEIGILYPLLRRSNRRYFDNLLAKINTKKPCIWLNDPDDFGARKRVYEDGIKIQTIHSAKGLQYKAVIVLWADELPRAFEGADIDQDRRIFYVGLTRPEDYLAISYSGNSQFIEIIKKSGLARDI